MDDSSSSSEVLDYEEPVTPAGRLFHRPEMEQVINCAVGVKNPIADAEAIKEEIKKSLMIKHPRFRSVLVRDKRGREHWRRLSHVDLDSHVESVCVIESEPGQAVVGVPRVAASEVPRAACPSLLGRWDFVDVFVPGVLEGFGVKDVKTCISGGDGVELLPRKLATAKFKLDDLKFVKNAVSNATINDVLFGVISSGLSRYLDLKSPNELQEGLEITGLAMVNLRKQPGLQELSKLMKDKSSSRWGNKFGFMMVPVYYHKHATRDPLEYASKAKATIDQKKLSLEAHFTYILGYLAMTLLGPKVAACLNYRIICNTSFTVSNIFGPQEEITCAGNPVTYLRAITMHMVSYVGNAEMQVLAAKDIIPEPKVLAKCFEEALLEMKSAVQSSTDSTLKQLPGH
ncbi:hypothetical protein Syun_004302 [Stephania yunnanensis]|uniref:O-acyltransferase WSD1 C-terminal domain-containing protein n=1 Tax=Stephania yunnanensis TaxID=152371 RepID=A0AAP0L3Q5_9MAGN